MRVLGVLRLAVAIELESRREILLAEQHADVVLRLRGRALRDARGVGTHVRDEPLLTIHPDVDALVEILRDAHRALGSERQLLRRLLLQRGGRERRRWVLAALAPFDLGDAERRAAIEVRQHAVRFGLVVDLRLVAVDLVELRGEALPRLLQQRLDGPVLDGPERADLALTLDDEPQRHGLHAAGRDALLHRLPEHWARLVADEAV